MKQKRTWIMLWIVMSTILLMNQLPDLGAYVQTVKVLHARDAFSYEWPPSTETYKAMPVSDERDAWMSRIADEADTINEPASNARIDRVWKAIPPYKGLKVNLEQTYQVSRKGKGDIYWVLEEVEPQIELSDLGAQPIYRGNPRKPMTALMINVAWGEEYLPAMLETLDRENVSATFFLDGSWLSKHMDTARELLRAGHELSNHAYSHPNMSELSAYRARTEIEKTEKLLRELGVDNQLFAPPSGDFDQETVKIAKSLGLYTILWTLDTVDWRHPPPAQIVQKIRTQVEPGALILMHPTDSSSAALPEMIKEIKKKGLHISTVSDLISPNRVDSVEVPLQF
ncbi:polysaccharide deacetylase family protein [Marinicrinis sediminis]|uniref:Polysaccharide deacetylase family protein n=1 Tax=Marinicrinis sediminis TaxID=1652465 RepID=A0ABW5R545_9BACL